MAPDQKKNQAQNEEALKTEEALRLVKAFRAVDSRPVREALIVIAEHLGAVRDPLQ